MTGIVTDLNATLLQDEADLITAGVALQTEGLKLLLAEMQALAALLPHGLPGPTAPETSAEIEEGFDNMPV
jgi:hypothetical protein